MIQLGASHINIHPKDLSPHKVSLPTRRMVHLRCRRSRDNIIKMDSGNHTTNPDSKGITTSQDPKRQHLRPILIRSPVHSRSPDAVAAKVARLDALASWLF